MMTLKPTSMETQKARNRALFWIALLTGGSVTLLLIVFIWGNLIGELIDDDINTTLRGEYFVFLLGFCELLLGTSIFISWKRPIIGGYAWTSLAIIIAAVWGIAETITFLYFHLPAIVSGVLMLTYAYSNRIKTA